MLKAMKLETQLLLAFILVGIIPVVLIGTISLNSSSHALLKQSFAQLQSVREIKKAQIEQFFAEHKSNMDALTLLQIIS